MLKWLALLLIVLPLAARAEAPTPAAARAPAQVTKAAAAVSLQDFAGHRVAFSTLQRDATLIALWSAACVPCIEEMPLLDALYKKLGGDPHFAVIGIGMDEDEDLPAAHKVLATHKVSYPMLRDPQLELLRTWFPGTLEQLQLPLIMVFDRQFHAVYLRGFKPGTTAATFIADWSAQLTRARAGKLHEHLQPLAPPKGAAIDPAQMAIMIEKMVRSHYPELSAAELKARVDAALKQFRDKGSFSIE